MHIKAFCMRILPALNAKNKPVISAQPAATRQT